MISVLTLTYKRHHLLEEAIQSFLSQELEGCEMVIINDNKDVDYIYEHPNVRVINHKERYQWSLLETMIKNPRKLRKSMSGMMMTMKETCL